MSGTDDKDAAAESEQGSAKLFGRIQGRDQDEEGDSAEHEEVDRVAKQMRASGADGGDGQPSLEQQSDVQVEGQAVDDDEFEDVLLDALGEEASAPTGPGTPRVSAEPASDPATSTDTRPTHGEDSLQTDGSISEAEAEDGATEGAEGEEGVQCPSCGAHSPEGMRFCVQCGTKLAERSTQQGEGRFKRTDSDIRVPSPEETSQQGEIPAGMRLVMIRDDGSDGESIDIRSSTTVLGRDADKSFPNDEFLNAEQTRLTVEGGTLYIEDLDSLNGTFLKLRDDVRLKPGDTFLMGRQVLRFEKIEEDFDAEKTAPDGTRYMGSPAPGGDFKLVQIGVGDTVQDIYCLPESGVVLGREKGDIIFPRDKFMSGRHARIFTNGARHLVDLNSSNGTWIKLWEKTALKKGDYIFMGQQLFRVDLGG